VDTAQIIQEFYGPVHRFLRGLSQSTATADDLAQETFLELLRRDSSTVRNPKSYVMQVAYSRWVRYLRHREASKGVVSLEDSMDPHDPRPSAGMASGDRAELLDRVRRCLADVSPQEQALFVLVSVLDYSWTEVAAILELPRTTVVSQHRRLVERMRWEVRRAAT
jgi:RNA polymerase sigma factor (sigma-70 family)